MLFSRLNINPVYLTQPLFNACFYGLRSIFVLYIIAHLSLPKGEAITIYSTFMALCYVTTLLGDMQDYVAVSGRDVRVLPPSIFGDGGLPLSTALGVAGMPGLTAYAAMVADARARPGETFVVSSADHGPARGGDCGHRGEAGVGDGDGRV